MWTLHALYITKRRMTPRFALESVANKKPFSVIVICQQIRIFLPVLLLWSLLTLPIDRPSNLKSIGYWKSKYCLISYKINWTVRIRSQNIRVWMLLRCFEKRLHRVPKHPPFIFSITLSKINRFYWFLALEIPSKIWHENHTDCPPRLSDEATVPWEIEKVIFNGIIHTYFWLFTLFHKKTICNPLAHPTWKYHHTNWLKVCCVLSDVGGQKTASCGLSSVALKRTGCDEWQLECQASNVTANVQSDRLLH